MPELPAVETLRRTVERNALSAAIGAQADMSRFPRDFLLPHPRAGAAPAAPRRCNDWHRGAGPPNYCPRRQRLGERR